MELNLAVKTVSQIHQNNKKDFNIELEKIIIKIN